MPPVNDQYRIQAHVCVCVHVRAHVHDPSLIPSLELPDLFQYTQEKKIGEAGDEAT